jgi:hypothetical protein
MQFETGTYQSNYNEDVPADTYTNLYVTEKLYLENVSNQIIIGSDSVNNTTINTLPPAAPVIYSIIDVSTDANFVLSEGTQTLNGNYTFTAPVNISNIIVNDLTVTGLTPLQAVLTDADSKLVSKQYSAAATGDSIVYRDPSGQSDFNQIDVNTINAGTTTSTFIVSDDISCVNLHTDILGKYLTTEISLQASILPSPSSTYTLGSTTNRFLSLDADTVYTQGLDSRTSSVFVYKDLIPINNNLISIGSNSNRVLSIDSSTIYLDTLTSRSSNISLLKSILPTDSTYSLGDATHRFTALDTLTTYTDTLTSRSSNISLLKSLLPTDAVYSLGDSTHRFTTLDTSSDIYCGGQLNTRAGNLNLNSATSTITSLGDFWINRASTSGSGTSYAQNLNISTDQTLFLGPFSGPTNYYSTIQSYKQTAFSATPLVIQPGGSRMVVGSYDASAIADTNLVYINGSLKSTGNIYTSSTTNATGFTTASIYTDGGARITKSLWLAQSAPDSLECQRINTQTTTTLQIGSTIGSGHTLTVSGSVDLNTTGTGYTATMGNVSTGATTSITGNPLNLGDSGTTGNTTLRGATVSIQTASDNVCTLGNTSSTTQQNSIYNALIRFYNNAVASSVRSVLSYWEDEYSWSTLVNGAWAAGSRPTIVIKLSRYNKRVIAVFPTLSQTATVAGSMSNVTAMPTRFIPTIAAETFIVARNNGAVAQGWMNVNTSGNFGVSLWTSVNSATANFTGASTAGWTSFCMAWDTA